MRLRDFFERIILLLTFFAIVALALCIDVGALFAISWFVKTFITT